MLEGYELVHNVANGGGVYVRRGNRGPSRHDFHVSYLDPNGRRHNLPHSFIVEDVYRKRKVANPEAFDALMAHLLNLIGNSVGVGDFPPGLVQFRAEHVQQLEAAGLGGLPGVSLELLLVAFEMIQIQEETRVRNGRVPTELFRCIRNWPEDLMPVANLTIFGHRDAPVRNYHGGADRLEYQEFKFRERDNLLRRLIQIDV